MADANAGTNLIGITPDELIPNPHELVLRHGVPETIAGWKALVDGLLTDQPCAFHRNLEISSRYAWIYTFLPAYLKWAGMAAFASHHVRLALFPFRLDDIFWVHLAYGTAEDGIGRLRPLLGAEPHYAPFWRASRRSTKDAVSWRTGRRPRRLGGRPRTSSGMATSSSSSTSSAPWCNPTSIASRARSPGSSPSARR